MLESHRRALAGEMEASQTVLTDLIFDEIARIEDIRPIMQKIDPLRVVWNGPVASDATGLRGFGESDAQEAFINACEEGYDNGPLHAWLRPRCRRALNRPLSLPGNK